MSRFVTGSRFDHVGVMLKYPKSGHLQIFESLRQNGVSKWNWTNFIAKKQYQSYDKIVYRKLNLYGQTKEFRDRESFDKAVFKFVVKTVGNPFKLTFDAILGSVTQDFNAKVNDRGFFCSELITVLF